ncbi:MAG TPA: hypothetical protein VFJ97_00480 [Dermatophilaceae bacterium]|nr:hypothetical protein [Dermatophilaceae bacterium]
MAFWGLAGAVGLAGGGIDLGSTITARLPWQSLQVAGLALFVAVAVPMTIVMVSAWRGSPSTGAWSVAAGLALIGWIAVEIAIIRTYSWMQPASAGYGLVMVLLGRHALRQPPTR